MADGLKVLVAGEGQGSGLDASVNGEVVRVGDCLGLRVERTEYPVVWPPGTSIGDDGRAVQLGDGQVVLGDTVTGSGGFLTGKLPESSPPIPTTCAPEEGEVVFLDAARMSTG